MELVPGTTISSRSEGDKDSGERGGLEIRKWEGKAECINECPTSAEARIQKMRRWIVRH